MATVIEQVNPVERKVSSPKVKQYIGEVVYIYAFDVAYDMTRKPVRELLGQPVAQFAVDAASAVPGSFSSTNRRWCACRRWNASAPMARCASSA